MVSEMSDLSISKNDRASHSKFITLPTILTLGRVASIPLLVASVFPLFHYCNLTVFRFLHFLIFFLIFFYLAFYMDGWQGTAITTSIFTAAAITDWLDGYIARKVNLFMRFLGLTTVFVRRVNLTVLSYMLHCR